MATETLAVFNINDAGVQVAVGNKLIRTSPGYALLDNQQLLTGEAASQKVRLLPRWTNNRFWSQLNTAPLAQPSGPLRHHADLAFAHLENLWQPIKKKVKQVIFCVPGDYSAENLGLLLGLAKECALPITGVVDQSLVAACNLSSAPTLLHLDIQLHQITLSRLSNQNLLVKKHTKTITDIGLANLRERWADIIAKQFVQATRFDPLHEAATEQQMFDKLPGWISSLDASRMTPFELTHEKGKQSTNVSRDALLGACTFLYPQIVQMLRQEMPAGAPASLFISHLFAGFPGLHDSLSLIKNLELVYLSESKILESVAQRQDEIVRPQNQLAHILQFSGSGTSSAESPKNQPDEGQAATHLLWQHQATPIGMSFKLGRDLSSGVQQDPAAPVCTLYPRHNELLMECHDKKAIRVNDKKPAQLMPLVPGDQLSIGTQTLLLIRVPADG